MAFTVFYDGQCPLCVAEMDMLRRENTDGALRLEDINAPAFNERYPQIDVDEANRILHGMDNDGSLLLGLDVTVKAWQTVGKKRWLVFLRWPLIRWFADKAYLFFARHRMRISSLLMGAGNCAVDGSSCSTSSPSSPSSKSAKNCARNVNEDAEF